MPPSTTVDTLTGWVTDVWDEQVGGYLTADAEIGDTLLQLDDAADFQAAGGWVLLGNDAPVEYVSADVDADTLTLAVPLDETLTEDAFAHVWDPQNQLGLVEPRALIELAVEAPDKEGVTVSIAHTLADRVARGDRGGLRGEHVVLNRFGSSLRMVDIVSKPPVVDGSYVIPGSVDPSDGLPPATSPAVALIGGIAQVFASWEAVENTDPVTYDVYADDDTPVTIVPLHLVASTPATYLAFDAAPGDLYVSVVARDADGQAAPGPESLGTVLPVPADVDLGPINAEIDALQARFPITSPDLADLAVLSTKLADNAVLTGKIAGGAITSTLLADGAVLEAKLAANSVTLGKVATGAIGSTQLVDGAILEAKLAANAVTLGKIATGAVGSSQLVDGAVLNAKLAALAVDAGKLADGAVVNAKLAANAVATGNLLDDAVNAAKIAASAVGSGELAAGAVIAGKIAALTIVAGDIAANTITAAQVAADTLTASQIAADAITSNELAAGAVVAGKIAALTIVAGDIAASTITGAKIAGTTITAGNIAADTITAAQIAASAITASELAALSVSAGHIVANTITAGQIAADTITASQIAANAVTSSELNAGAVVAGKIAAGTIVAADIAADTITASQLAANSVTASELTALAVTAGKIAADAVTAAEIAANAVTASEIAALSISAGHIVADTITAGQIAANAVTASEIAALAVTAGKVAALSITAGEIAANTITASQIAANTITATQIAANTINTGQLAANAITVNELSANAITSKHTILGATLIAGASATTGERVIVRPDGSGGLIEFFSGVAGETSANAGIIDPAVHPTTGAAMLTIRPGRGTTLNQRPIVKMFATADGLSASTLDAAGGQLELDAVDVRLGASAKSWSVGNGDIYRDNYGTGVLTTGGAFKVGGRLHFGTTYSISSGTLAGGGEYTTTVTHNLGVVPTLVVGHLEDGSFSPACGWRVNTRSTTTVNLTIRNNGTGTASAVLKFKLLFD
jgi:hypothetical protein